MTFRSAVDWWLAAVLLGTPIALLFVVSELLRDRPPGALWIAGMLVVLGVLLPLWIFASTRYRIEAGELEIRSGPCRWRIPLSDIHSVEPTRSPLSSPALSLSRLEIRYGDSKRILVSPADADGFVDALGVERRGSH